VCLQEVLTGVTMCASFADLPFEIRLRIFAYNARRAWHEKKELTRSALVRVLSQRRYDEDGHIVFLNCRVWWSAFSGPVYESPGGCMYSYNQYGNGVSLLYVDTIVYADLLELSRQWAEATEVSTYPGETNVPYYHKLIRRHPVTAARVEAN
jgi:hypothetical protein